MLLLLIDMTNKWRVDFSGSAKRVAVVGAGVRYAKKILFINSILTYY